MNRQRVAVMAALALGVAPLVAIVASEHARLGAHLFPGRSESLPVVCSLSQLRRVRPVMVPYVGLVRLGIDTATPSRGTFTIYALASPRPRTACGNNLKLLVPPLYVLLPGSSDACLACLIPDLSRLSYDAETLYVARCVLPGPGAHTVVIRGGRPDEIARRVIVTTDRLTSATETY